MTREQKQLLRSVPVAALIFGGLFASQYNGMRDAADRPAGEPEVTPAAGPGPRQVKDASDRLRESIGLQVLADVERQLEKDEEFVRSAEAIYAALREVNDAEAWKKPDEQVGKAIAAIGKRQSLLRNIRVNAWPDGDRARVIAAQVRCVALIERLAQCRQPAGPAAPDRK